MMRCWQKNFKKEHGAWDTKLQLTPQYVNDWKKMPKSHLSSYNHELWVQSNKRNTKKNLHV